MRVRGGDAPGGPTHARRHADEEPPWRIWLLCSLTVAAASLAANVMQFMCGVYR